MEWINSPRRMQDYSMRARREGVPIGLVPTMGALHEGHLSLIRKALEFTPLVMVSVFVNPIQFGPTEDLSTYPRDSDRDRGLCEAAGVSVVFAPDADSMYASDHGTYVEETVLSQGLCGGLRPGHFRGVTTVVAKLFNIVLPDLAVFGRKDMQQAAVIRRMVRDLNIPVRIVVAPIVREPDGLAMSSRNAYLTEPEREQATCLYRALREAERMVARGKSDTAVIRDRMREVLAGYPLATVEYLETLDEETLQPVAVVRGRTLIALRVRIGRTHLIDNTTVA